MVFADGNCHEVGLFSLFHLWEISCTDCQYDSSFIALINIDLVVYRIRKWRDSVWNHHHPFRGTWNRGLLSLETRSFRMFPADEAPV